MLYDVKTVEPPRAVVRSAVRPSVSVPRRPLIAAAAISRLQATPQRSVVGRFLSLKSVNVDEGKPDVSSAAARLPNPVVIALDQQAQQHQINVINRVGPGYPRIASRYVNGDISLITLLR